jgi:hypothetical protein
LATNGFLFGHQMTQAPKMRKSAFLLTSLLLVEPARSVEGHLQTRKPSAGFDGFAHRKQTSRGPSSKDGGRVCPGEGIRTSSGTRGPNSILMNIPDPTGLPAVSSGTDPTQQQQLFMQGKKLPPLCVTSIERY